MKAYTLREARSKGRYEGFWIGAVTMSITWTAAMVLL